MIGYRTLITSWLIIAVMASIENEVDLETLLAIDYLEKYGYLASSKGNIKSAIDTFQNRFGLTVSSVADADTQKIMLSPRCANADFRKKKRHLVLPNVSTYRMKRPSMILHRKGFLRALKMWTRVTRVTFKEVLNLKSDVNFDVKFISIANKTTFHESPPKLGGVKSSNVRFNTFVRNFPNKYSSYQRLAAHLIGHALGFEHTYRHTSVMFPLFPKRVTNVSKLFDAKDFEIIRKLYPISTAQKYVNSAIGARIEIAMFLPVIVFSTFH